jgi:DNA invertase Pin-like site-specific DNA recombinase
MQEEIAIIYVRKSTDDKINQQHTLDYQLEWSMNFAETKNIQVFKVIIEAESAYKIDNRD